MNTHHKDDCHCGSGKRYKHCHLAADQARGRRAWTIGLALVGAVVVGAGAWGLYGMRPGAQGAADSLNVAGGGSVPGGAGDVSGAAAPTGGAFGGLVPGMNSGAPLTPEAAGAAASANAALAPGENPTPWQYEIEKNRHYDPRPGHGHWHSGPPPSDTSQGGAMPTPTITTVGGTAGVSAVTTTTTTSATPVPAGFRADLAPGENPAPWEFDAKNNKYFDPRPEHRHWHPGPPPPASAR